jgi:ComF family protein
MKPYWQAFESLFFPRVCCHCLGYLLQEESFLCTYCRAYLPEVPDLLKESERLLQRFVIPELPTQVYAFLRFHKRGMAQSLLHQIKYRGAIELGQSLGVWMASKMLHEGIYPGIDYILPVPLHASKQKLRGYNQSYHFARGLSDVWNTKATDDILIRLKASDSQTRKNRLERWQNVENIFKVVKPEELEGKSVMLVDDVFTTGATLEACILALQEAKPRQIYVAVIAAAQ